MALVMALALAKALAMVLALALALVMDLAMAMVLVMALALAMALAMAMAMAMALALAMALAMAMAMAMAMAKALTANFGNKQTNIMSFNNLSKVWTPDTLTAGFEGVFPELNPDMDYKWIKGITVHHCAEPSLSQRPQGFKQQHLVNLRDFYRDNKGWSTGPHLFTDEDQIFGLTPLYEQGTHAVSFNRTHIGIEMLGDYDTEDPRSGRGLRVIQTTCDAIVRIQRALHLPITAFNFHRDDPKTKKTCAGVKITRDWFLQQLQEASSWMDAPKHKRVSTSEAIDSGIVQAGNRSCVPVYRYLKDHGVWREGQLECRGEGEFYYHSNHLEGAWYDATTGTTWAPVSELVEFTL